MGEHKIQTALGCAEKIHHGNSPRNTIPHPALLTKAAHILGHNIVSAEVQSETQNPEFVAEFLSSLESRTTETKNLQLALESVQPLTFDKLSKILEKHGFFATGPELKTIVGCADTMDENELSFEDFLSSLESTKLRCLNVLEQLVETSYPTQLQTQQTCTSVSGKGAIYHKQSGSSFIQQSNCFTLTIGSPCSFLVGVQPNAYIESAIHDLNLAILDQTHKCVGVTTRKREEKNEMSIDVPPGKYKIVPFSINCVFKPSTSDLSAEPTNLTVNANGTVKLSKMYKMTLLNIFDFCDLDSNGLLSNSEFSFYNLITSGEMVEDSEWEVVKNNFECRDEQLTVKGFTQLHELDVQERLSGEADEQREETLTEVWNSLHTLGFSRRFVMERVQPFLLSVTANMSNAIIDTSYTGPEPMTDEVQSEIATYLHKLADKEEIIGNIQLKIFDGECFSAIVMQNSSGTTCVLPTINTSNSVNVKSHLVNPAESLIEANKCRIVMWAVPANPKDACRIHASVVNTISDA